ncbi:tubulin-tyrosine ligase/Tubulin polyglutamylase, partial [Cladochytrium replicatum]
MNHFPKTGILTRKDSLFRMLKTLQAIHGSAYSFFPLTYSLPNEYVKFVKTFAEEEVSGNQSAWICKPTDLSRGRGIFVFKDLKDLTYDCCTIVQRYISDPYLIDGYKFDLRCYVAVKSYNPLQVYICEEGLVRFATSRYDMMVLSNRFSHLTNTSINKLSPHLNDEKGHIGSGCKWSLSKLRWYLKESGVPFDQVWQRIKGLSVLTLLPISTLVPEFCRNKCFELYGFDIVLDSSLKPWLVEVNMSPALSVDCHVDIEVKKPMLEDLLTLAGLNNKPSNLSKTSHDSVNKTGSRVQKDKVTRTNLDAPNNFGTFTRIYPTEKSSATMP